MYSKITSHPEADYAMLAATEETSPGLYCNDNNNNTNNTNTRTNNDITKIKTNTNTTSDETASNGTPGLR